MNATRQDAWTKDEDIILAETVLRYIRGGKTQLEAFKDVARQLSRTSAACGFRWNATIRQQYKDAIEQAKQERKKGEHGETLAFADNGQAHQSDKNPIDAAIWLLEKMKTTYPDETNMTQQEQEDLIQQLKKENEYLNSKLIRYEEAWREMGKLWRWVSVKDNEKQLDRVE